ncbi:hypothetical protein L9F63_018014 [Diploptera punctata]|uniref:G-protein coupled receptors family 1 profile domain-containing protein n=1 Tax=Diploptera punctata TaxID=6984 RepID=A0AAD7ZXT8_DIPPU|nr:hypothetical protein L9F63_018014 [Diploptera punctata]
MLVTLVFIMVFTPCRPQECPAQCRCSNYKTWCRFSRFYKLPSLLPNTTQLLSIQYDNIKVLNTSMVTKSGLCNLTHLELNSVQLQQIEPGSFKDMNLLQKLIITNNNVIELHADTFKYLNNLYYLKLQDNKVISLHERAFKYITNVRYLYLNNWTTLFPKNVFNSVKNNSNCEAMETPGVLEIGDNFNLLIIIDSRSLQHLCSFTHITISSSSSQHLIKDTFLGATKLTDLKLRYDAIGLLTNVFDGLEQLIKLTITSTGLQNIEIGAFESLIGLKYLDLSYNKLSEIRSGMFRGLRSLKVLKLDYSDISILDKNGFRDLQSLERLSLDHCQINSINNETFKALKHLRELFISSYNMKQIDSDAFNGLSQIKIIDISFVHIYNESIISLKNNTFSKLKTLGVVNLSDTKFSVEAGTFTEVWAIQIFSRNISHELQNVTYSDIKYEITLQRVTFVMEATFCDIGIRATVKSVRGHQTLQELQLFVNGKTPNLKNQVQDLINNTVNFSQLNQISHLDISNCTSAIFKENSFFGFANIKSLTLNYISISAEIHANALKEIKSLTSFTIKYNQHVVIAPGAFNGLNNLKKLELYKHRETVIKHMWTIRGPNSRIYLNVNESESTQLEAGMFLGLDNLQILTVHGYANTFVKKGRLYLTRGTFQGLHNIIEIHMTSNGITEISPGVFGAECVEHFKLSCKNVSEPSQYCNDTHALKTLQHLDLSSNYIQHIHQHAFISCLNLKILNLEWNKMLTLDNTFLFTPVLTTLKMMECNVTKIPNNTFECTPNIYELSLSIVNSTPRVISFLPLKQLKLAEISIFGYNITCDFYETWLWFQDKHIIVSYTKTAGIDLYNLNCNRTHHLSQLTPNTKVNINDSLYLKQYIEPIILVVLTTSGIVFNAFLLFVSLWNSDMRTKHNSCIIHLSITDTLSLILNLPLSYWNTLHVNWELGVLTCKRFMFLKDVTLVANIFSVVALSVERFLVTRRWKDLRKACKTDYPIWWLLVMTWISGIVLSLPVYYNASVHTRCLYCPPNNEEYIKRVWIYQFIVHYFLPAVVICALNTMTSRYLRRSVKNLPGVVNDNIRTKNRKTVANIVSILSAIFVFSYLPNFILRVLVAWSVIDRENVVVYSFVSFCLFYCNTLFNPISIFIMSSKYKSYFFKYFPFLRSNTDTKISFVAKKIN